MEALERLASSAVVGMAQLGGLVMSIVIGGKFLWFIVSGGSERAFASLLKTVGMLVIALAVLSNIPGTVDLLTTLAGALYSAVLGAVRGAAA